MYRQWAESYDGDLDGYGYVAPGIGVRIFQQLLPDRQSLIYDAGCGTGQVGQLLCSLGYKNIVGADFSSDMLEIAKAGDSYQSLLAADYTKPLECPANTYDGIISIGVYTKRFKQVFIDEMIRVLKPGGWLVFSCRPVYFEEVAGSVKDLHSKEYIVRSSVVYDDYMVGQNASAYYISLQKVPEQ